jgi:hypothetical protein
MVLVAGAVCAGLTAALGSLHLAGRSRALGLWLFGPGLVLLAGATCTVLGTGALLHYVGKAPVSIRPKMLGMGLSAALEPQVAATSLSALFVLAIAGLGAWAYRREVGKATFSSPRAIAAVVSTLILGSVMWAIESSNNIVDSPAPFVVFVLSTGAALCCASVCSPSPTSRATMAKVQTCFAGLLSVMLGAWATSMQKTQWLYKSIALEAPADRHLAAIEYSNAADMGAQLTLIGWSGVVLLAVLLPLLGSGQLIFGSIRWVRQAVALVLVLAIIVPATRCSSRQVQATKTLVVPAFLEGASIWYFGQPLSDAELLSRRQDLFHHSGVWDPLEPSPSHPFFEVAVPSQPGVFPLDPVLPLRQGDMIVSVEKKPVSGLLDLLDTVRACRCGMEDNACVLQTPCFDAGSAIAVVVQREKMEEVVLTLAMKEAEDEP